jgi:FkbM family methyltransferase
MLTGTTAAVLSVMLDRIGPDNRAWLARQVVLNRRSRRTKSLVEFSELVALAYANAQYDVAINGETWLLNRLAAFSPRVMIDVGANRGEWCIAAFQTNPTATIHAFEIVGETFNLLVENTKAFRSRIIVNGCGLSDKNGSLEIFHVPDCDVHSSFLADAHKIASDREYVRISRPVRTGDDYLAEKNVAKIDMLKIDVEGAEPMVLDGFRDALSQHKIDVIQFEYGKHSLLTRYFLRDFYDRLGSYGYVLGKLFPDGVAFKQYDIADENFIGPNYVACRAERRDIIAAVTLR